MSYPARHVEPRYLDSIADDRPRRLRLSPADSAELAQIARSSLQMPAHHDPVVTLNVGAGGSAWVRLDELDTEVDRWLVVASDGRVRGVASLPAGTVVRWNDDESVWVVERDEFDVSWLVRYRLGEQP